ncbi:MAG TPA: phage tail tape measure protein [Phycisphaerales bacterium]|nr:phage tail tape measure protein [Phycisphaerales bacterium]
MAGAKGIRAGRAFVELGVSDKLTAGLRAAQRRLKAFGAGVRYLGTRIAAIGTAGLAPLAASVRSFASAGDTLEKMSRRTGIGVEALSELGFAAEQSGADLQTLEAGVRVLQRTINDAERGLSTAKDALADLGLTAEQLRGLTPEEQIKAVADRLARIPDPAKRAAVAMQLLGRSGTRLLPLVEGGAAGIEELQEQARALGLTVSTEAAKDAALLTDTLNILWRVVRQGVFEIGSALAPTVIDLANAVTRAVITATNWVRENKAVIVTAAKVAAAVVAAGVALIGLGLLISGVGAVFGVLAGVVGAVGTALGFIGTVLGALLSPIGLIVSAVAGLGTALLVWSGAGGEALAWLRDQFGKLREFATKVIGGIADALAAGDITLAAEILWLALKLAWQRGVAELNKVWLQARAFFVGTAQKMWFGALAAAQQVLHALEVAWIETTAFLSKTWTRFTSGFTKIWERASAFVAKRMLEIQGLFDSSLNVEAAKRAVDQQLEARLSDIDEGARRDLSRREQRRQAERNRSRELNEATLAEIGRQFEEAQEALQQGTDARLTETQRQLEEARRRLDEAIAEARRKREEADADGTPRRGVGDLLADLEDRLAGIGDAIAARVEVRGTFNALAVQGLAGSADAAERTATATEQTAKNTKRLADAARAGGLTFG